MCGIAGWLSNGGQFGEESLLAMAELIRHRGPDDRGTFVDANSGVAIVHNRLSIIDLSSAGHQPMINDDRSAVLAFNGEIYNFVELRQELRQAGHSFTSRTDSEVILHGFEQWGDGVVEKLYGMFAFVVWDAPNKRLFMARDPMGIKPLYWWRSPHGDFVFASEIKAFLALSCFEPRPNMPMLRQYLEFNFVYDTIQTSLRDVYKLPAGHWMSVTRDQLGSSAEPKSFAYFQPPRVEPARDCDIDTRSSQLYETLDQVVEQHLVADVPVSVLLSGGLDSSIVTALAARRSRVHTISMGFAQSALDERPFARDVATWLGTTHEEVVIQPREIFENLEDAVWYVDDLFGDWGVISTMLLYRKCRDVGTKVVLVGEGSDELFGGYPNYISAGGQGSDRHSFARRTLQLYRWYSGRRWGNELWRFAQLVRRLGGESDNDFFSTIRLFETRHQLPHCFNMKVDKASMAVSVEARVPFLDVRVARLGFRTPRALLLRDGTNKYLLRHMAKQHGLLPPQITSRPKLGGSIAADWLDNSPQFRAFARDAILDPQGLTSTLGLTREMKAYFEHNRQGSRFPRGISIYSIVAWRLLLLNLWAKRYLKLAVWR